MLPQIDHMFDDYDGGRVSRRGLILQLTALLGAAAGVRAQEMPSPAPEWTSTFSATEINHIALRVTDVSRSAQFYREHLGLTPRSNDSPNSVFLNVGQRDFLALFRGDEPAMDHYCYTVNGYNADAAMQRLEAAGLAPRRSGSRVYFDDPDGLEVQVSAPNLY